MNEHVTRDHTLMNYYLFWGSGAVWCGTNTPHLSYRWCLGALNLLINFITHKQSEQIESDATQRLLDQYLK